MLGSKAAVVALVLAGAAALAAGFAARAADIDEHACRLTAAAVPAAFGKCATLLVAEDPTRPGGPTVELFVARVAAQSAEPRRDPLLLIAGGPGQSTVDFYLQQRGAFEQVRRDRDIILVDQRGTGRSAAGFACKMPDDLALDTAGNEQLQRFVERCATELGHDPRFYTTSVAVQDLERVRAAFGIPEWNVYGVSYGTRVAQHYLKRFPEHTRAVVIDGVVPAGLALGPDIAREAQRALDQIFARCAADAGCAAKFPDLRADFTRLLARLDAADAASVAMRGATARAVVRFLSYSATTAALLPVLIHEAATGNDKPLVGQADTVLRGLPESLSFPMSNAVTCTEDAPFVDANSRAGLADTYLGTTIVDALGAICARWPVGAIDDDFRTPVVSDRPVLLLSGEDDPITPPAYAERAIVDGLRNSVHVVGRGQGHGLVAVGCMPRMLRAFLEKPVPAELAIECMADEPPLPFFLTLQGPAP